MLQVDLFGEDNGESSKEWSPVYYALESIERLLIREELAKQVLTTLSKTNTFGELLTMFCISHPALLVRLIAHRVMAAIFRHIEQS